MKKLFYLCLMMLFFTGCFQNKTSIWEEEMKRHATAYYEAYMKDIHGQTKNDISIASLKNANEKVGAAYDLKKLSSCKDSSYVTITVDAQTKNIKNYTYHLDCK